MVACAWPYFTASRDPCLCWFPRAVLILLMLLCNGACRRDCCSGILCLGRVTVCPLRDRALVNFIHGCSIIGWSVGPLARDAGVVALACPIVIDIALLYIFEVLLSYPVVKHLGWWPGITYNYSCILASTLVLMFRWQACPLPIHSVYPSITQPRCSRLLFTYVG